MWINVQGFFLTVGIIQALYKREDLMITGVGLIDVNGKQREGREMNCIFTHAHFTLSNLKPSYARKNAAEKQLSVLWRLNNKDFFLLSSDF